MAQHALVLGPGQSISPDSLHVSTAEGSSNTALQRAASPDSEASESTCLAPRAVIIQQKGFSDEVAVRIHFQPEPSTSQVGRFYQMVLVLGSGKRRSEIHAWLYKNIQHQEN